MRCAQYISALKIVCKCKISRQLCKILHITILSLLDGETIFEVFQQMLQMDRQTDDILWHHRAVKLGRQNVADIIGIADI